MVPTERFNVKSLQGKEGMMFIEPLEDICAGSVEGCLRNMVLSSIMVNKVATIMRIYGKQSSHQMKPMS